MERWENRYAHSRGGAVRGVEHSRADRIKNILLILLTVALVGVSIAGGQAIALRLEISSEILREVIFSALRLSHSFCCSPSLTV